MTMEVLAEVCYVLEGLYQVTREDIISNFRKLNIFWLERNKDSAVEETVKKVEQYFGWVDRMENTLLHTMIRV